jgi:peptide/nickel transport system substrate-binding protein
MKLSRRRFQTGALALVAASLSSAALAQQGEAVLRVVAPWEYTSNDPNDIGYILTRMGVAETLVQVAPDGALIPGVAARWSIDADKLTWRFALRAGATFHDGGAVTAQAVADSLRVAFKSDSLSAIPLDSVSADGGDVVIRTKTPFSVLPAFLVDYASLILAPGSYGATGKVEKIIATGPYRITEVIGSSTLELERFEGYPGAKPAIRKARYTAVSNGETRANIAIAGDADLVFTLAPTALQRINNAGQMKVESLTIPRIRMIAFNAGLPQFSDVRVRRALSLAIDRAGVAASILRHPASAATQLTPPMLREWRNDALPALTYDPVAARKLLDEAGWAMGADGVRVKDGARLAAKLMTIANRPELPVMAAAIQAQLKQVGVEVGIEAGPGANIPAAVKEGSMQMTLFTRSYVSVPEVMATIIPDYTRERSNWGTMNWPGRDRLKPLAEEYVVSFDAARKAAIRAEITKIIHDDAPVIPVSWFEHTVAVSNRLSNVTVDPYETRYMLDQISWKGQ